MKTVGIISEYNILHNGHKYHIDRARELTGSDYVIAVMSGSFVQRGEPAIADKYTRTRMALLAGVDAVFELPVYFSLGSAEYFATGAVKVLEALSVTDCMCFGSECGDIELLMKMSKLALNEDDGFSQRLLENIRSGQSFPKARSEAFRSLGADPGFSSPNDILGCEYCKALQHLNSRITPFVLKRSGAMYHDERLDCDMPSATALRKKILSDYACGLRGSRLTSALYDAIPESSMHALADAGYLPLSPDDFSQLLWYCASRCCCAQMTSILDIDEALARRIKNIECGNMSFSDYAAAVKSRQYTLSRIKRSLFHLILGIQTEQVKAALSSEQLPYVRLLGAKKTASALLRRIQSESKSLIITKVGDAPPRLDNPGRKMLECDIASTHICNRIAFDKLGAAVSDEYRTAPVII